MAAEEKHANQAFGATEDEETKARADQAKAEQAKEREKLIQRFQACEIRPRGRWFGCNPGPFPELEWTDPEAVKALYGDVPLGVRWFDAQLNEVQQAEKPGRYVAYVEGATSTGFMIRRAITIYCAAPGQEPWRPMLTLDEPVVELPFTDMMPFGKEIWTEQKEGISHAVHNGMLRDALFQDGQSVALIAMMAEQGKPLGRPATQLDWASTLNQDYHLKLKRKIMGIDDGRYPPFCEPRQKTGAPSKSLHHGTPAEAGMKEDTAQRLRAVCREWWEASGEPFTALVARHGVVVFHEAFGSRDGASVTLETHYPVASITKAISGLMFGQFIDQGLINPDDPVAKFLPDFEGEGKDALTLRHCFTHTSGLEGHGLWYGMENPYLENVIASGLNPEKIGRVAAYNGMGCDLAGKVMEVVSGKSFFRLMHENLFRPMGMSPHMVQGDLGYGVICRAEDLGRIAQLMLNRGSYGRREFMSPDAFNQLLPFRYREVFPGLKDCNIAYGLGIMWTRFVHSGLGPEDDPNQKPYLGRNTIGHGAATSCILRADLDNDLAAAVARFGMGKEYDKYAARFYEAIQDSLLAEAR